jgi:Spirocyclase AveC-like
MAEKSLPAATIPERSPRVASPNGSATGWAILGAAWIIFIIYGVVRWVISGPFGPVPIQGPDHYATWRLVGLRGLEASSVLFVVMMVTRYVVRPWRRERKLRIEGMLMIGGTLGFFIDPVINIFHYTFAWNQHAVNLGTWLSIFPGRSNEVGPYAEGLLWAFPQYIMMSAGAALAGYWIVTQLRQRFPGIGIASALAVVFVAFFIGDLIIENIFLVFQVYAFPRTFSGLTIFAGKLNQFPLYESIFVGAQAIPLTLLMLSARESDDGLSFVERGAGNISSRYQVYVRCGAIIGFTLVVYAFGYFLPWSWLSVTPDSFIHIPSYLQAGTG